MSTRNRFAKSTWVTIGGVAGLVAIIGLIVAVLQLVQNGIVVKAQSIDQATQKALAEEQLDLYKSLATLQAEDERTGPTATAAAQREAELLSTIEASQPESHPTASPTAVPSQTPLPPTITNTNPPPPTAVPAPRMIAAYRWYHKVEADWVTLRQDAASDKTLEGWGYSDKQLLFYAWEEPVINAVAVYRWHHKTDGDWITVVENSIPDDKLIEWGYREKAFLFYASSEPVEGGVSVYRWFNPTEKDWVDVPDGYQPDDKLIEWGYKSKTFLFYAVRP
jgi:hypothetical protein